jgi:hypothetical protein
MQGRFVQIDPLGFAGADLGKPQSFNMYPYAANDPLNITDPLGLVGQEIAGNCTHDIVITPEGTRDLGRTCDFDENDGYEGNLGWGTGSVFGLGDRPRDRRDAGPSEGGMSLQEAIYRGLGGRGDFVPAPRPFTDLDMIVMGGLGIHGLVGGLGFAGLAAGGSGTLALPQIPQLARIQLSKIAGNAFEESIAQTFRMLGLGARTQVTYRTALGTRYADVVVSHQGVDLFIIEAKLGASRYTAMQTAKDALIYFQRGLPTILKRSGAAPEFNPAVGIRP